MLLQSALFNWERVHATEISIFTTQACTREWKAHGLDVDWYSILFSISYNMKRFFPWVSRPQNAGNPLPKYAASKIKNAHPAHMTS